MRVMKLTRTGRIEKDSEATRDLIKPVNFHGWDGAHVQVTAYGGDAVSMSVGPYDVRLTIAELRHLLTQYETHVAPTLQRKSV